jgi:hypothetical protein
VLKGAHDRAWVLVASDADYRKARDVATQRGIKRPFIIFVPSKENSGFMGI